MKIIKYLFIALLVMVCNSCRKSFLDVKDNFDLNRQSYIKDLGTMEQFMNGIYLRLNGDQYEHGIGASYPDLVADNLKPVTSGAQSLISHYTWSQQKDENFGARPLESALNMNGIWRGHYLTIRACNFLIEDVDKYRAEDPVKADNMKGQAYAIRALLHFKLVNVFAQSYKFTIDGSHLGIPYITTSNINEPYSRQTVAEVYTKMIEDYTNAINLLPPASSDIRVMNQIAAKALLARVYLFMENYASAKSLSEEITSQFSLMTISSGYPNDLFKNKPQSATETFFQLTPINIYFPHVSRFIGSYLQGSTVRYVGTSDIADLLKENMNDIRHNWVENVSGEWRVTKFPSGAAAEVVPPITVAETAYYPPVIRSSEIFLILAESSAKLNDENTALSYLNAIRKRADPTIADVTVTGQALLDSIYKERRKELCFEGLRMYDLQRWKLGVHRMDLHPNYNFAKDLNYPNDKAIAPIPIQDTKLGGLQQNSSY